MKEFKCDSELNYSFSLCSTAESIIFAAALGTSYLLMSIEPPQGMTAC